MNRKPKMQRFTKKHFDRMFPDDATCLDWLFRRFFPDGMPHCEKCGKKTKHHRVASRPSYSCDYCGHHVHPTADTIFHKSPTPLTTWFYAVYLMASTRCGISAKQIERETGVTYKTAWRMFKQIRSMLEEETNPFGGPESHGVEMDETYYGGRRKGYIGRPGSGDKKKTPIIGVVERSGRIVAKAATNVNAETLTDMVKEYVMPESTVFTDDFSGYDRLSKHGYTHHRIKHSEKVYVMGNIHTNTVEGFWGLFKNGVRGVYHSVGKRYLQTYLNEYSFRFNRRFDVQPMFLSFMNQIEKRETIARQSPVPVEVEPF